MGFMRYIGLIACVAVAGCAEDYSPLTFRSSGTNLEVEGTIDRTTPELFREALQANPQVDTLILRNIDGSVDDDSNLLFSRAVRDAELNTHVPADGLIASGGTDLFLAGVERTIEDGACIGVHSWGENGESGAEVPRTDPIHSLYLDYYDTMGIDRAFYWFTLEVAPPEDMHWMTVAEAATFAITTESVDLLSSKRECENRISTRSQ